MRTSPKTRLVLIQTLIALEVIRWHDWVSRNTMSTTGPFAEINQLATFRAKWAKGFFLAPDNRLFTGGAGYDGGGFGHGLSFAKFKYCWCSACTKGVRVSNF